MDLGRAKRATSGVTGDRRRRRRHIRSTTIQAMYISEARFYNSDLAPPPGLERNSANDNLCLWKTELIWAAPLRKTCDCEAIMEAATDVGGCAIGD